MSSADSVPSFLNFSLTTRTTAFLSFSLNEWYLPVLLKKYMKSLCISALVDGAPGYCCLYSDTDWLTVSFTMFCNSLAASLGCWNRARGGRGGTKSPGAIDGL